jgi:hypothetical protein
MTIQEAYALANGFVNHLNEKRFLQDARPDAFPFKYSVGEMTEFTSCFYFEWKWLDLQDQELSEPPVAGPPGFTVSKADGSATIVSYVEWSGLHREEKRMDDLFTLLTNIKEKVGDLFKIKSTYNLSSTEILHFRKALQQESFDRYTVTGKLQEILKKIKA